MNVKTQTHRQPNNGATANERRSGQRARLLKIVHVGRRELNLSEEVYRTILYKKGGADSAKNMNAEQLQNVIDCFKGMGFKITAKTNPAKGAIPARLAADPESRKARAMWLTLHAIGQVRDPSETALQAYTRRLCKVDRLEWVQDPVPLIESLKAWLLRSLPDVVKGYLQRPVAAWAGHMPAIWHSEWERCRVNLMFHLREGHVQILNNWIALYKLIEEAEASK
jgi:phage gp16-like protein